MLICELTELLQEQVHNVVQSIFVLEHTSKCVGRPYNLSCSGVMLFIVIGEGIDTTKSHRSISEVPIRFLQGFLDWVDHGDGFWVARADFIRSDADEWAVS